MIHFNCPECSKRVPEDYVDFRFEGDYFCSIRCAVKMLLSREEARDDLQ